MSEVNGDEVKENNAPEPLRDESVSVTPESAGEPTELSPAAAEGFSEAAGPSESVEAAYESFRAGGFAPAESVEKAYESVQAAGPAGENTGGFAPEESAEKAYESVQAAGPAAENTGGFAPAESVEKAYESVQAAGPAAENTGGFAPAESAEAAYESFRGTPETAGAEAVNTDAPAAAGEPVNLRQESGSENEALTQGPAAPAPPRSPYVSPYDVYRFNGGTRPVTNAAPTAYGQPSGPSYQAQPGTVPGQPADRAYRNPAEGQQIPAWRTQPAGSPYRSMYGQPSGEAPMPRTETFDGNGGGGFGPGGPSGPSNPPEEPKKKGGKGKKAAAIIGIAALFGLVAALVFLGVSRILGGVFGIGTASESSSKAPEPPKVIIGSNDRNDESARQPAGRSDIAAGEDSEASRPETVPPVADGKDLSIPDVVELVMPSMVAITNTSLTEYRSLFGERGQYENVSTGSGIIVGETETDYLIATNAHVIEDAKKITVTFIDESVIEGTVSASDSRNDLAIVSVKKENIDKETISQIRIISIGNSDDLRVGETVIAIGNSLGYGQSVSRGVVSALNRPVEVDGYVSRELIQTDASINPGNSGGALINLRGELVGINEVKAVDTRVEGVGYAIPMAMAKPILENLGTKAARTKVDEANASYIGIHCMTMSSYYVQMGYPAGAYVSDVMAGGPAEKAGLQTGDIITSIDGSVVTTSTQLISYLEYYAAGEKVSFTVRRLNSTETAFDTLEIEITLGNKNEANFDQPQGEPG